MPVAPGDKQRIVALPGEVALDLLAGFLVDLLLLLLPDAVERLELRGALVGVDDMLGFKQLQRDVRIADPAGGVDARRHAESDVGRGQLGAQLRTFDQGPDTGANLPPQRFDAVFDHDPVFAEERNDIGDGSEGDIVEHLFEPGLESAEIVFAPVFDEGVRELEGGSGSGEELEVFEFGIDLRVDDRDGVRQLLSGLVMVGDDDVDAAAHGLVDGVAAGDAAVDGDEHAGGSEGVERLLERFRREAVPVVEPVRNERVDICAVLPQDEGEQSAGGNAVSVVVAVDQNGFFVGDGVPQPFGGILNTGEPVRVAEVGETRIQKILDFLFLDASCGKEEGDRARQSEFALYRIDERIQIIPGKFPIFYTHVSLSELIHFIQ